VRVLTWQIAMPAEFYDMGVTDEGGWGGGSVPIYSCGNFAHLPPNERRAAKERRKRWNEKLRKADAIRATWSDADFAAEEECIRAEIEAWLEDSHDAP
jgi:hypothetical protein